MCIVKNNKDHLKDFRKIHERTHILDFSKVESMRQRTLLVLPPSWGQQDLVPIAETTKEAFSRITAYESVQSSLQRIIETEPDTIQEQFRITEIPAPPYKSKKGRHTT